MPFHKSTLIGCASFVLLASSAVLEWEGVLLLGSRSLLERSSSLLLPARLLLFASGFLLFVGSLKYIRLRSVLIVAATPPKPSIYRDSAAFVDLLKVFRDFRSTKGDEEILRRNTWV